MRRVLVAVGLSAAVVALVVLVAYRRYRIPAQGSGDDWRVLGQAEIAGSTDAIIRTDAPGEYLDNDLRSPEGFITLIVPAFSGPCERVRITAVDLAPAAPRITVDSYRGFPTADASCGDAIAISQFFVLEVPEARIAGATSAEVNGHQWLIRDGSAGRVEIEPQVRDAVAGFDRRDHRSPSFPRVVISGGQDHAITDCRIRQLVVRNEDTRRVGACGAVQSPCL